MDRKGKGRSRKRRIKRVELDTVEESLCMGDSVTVAASATAAFSVAYESHF